MTQRSHAIGVDLGTVNTCVAVFRAGGVEIIPDEGGNRVMPSYVAFTETRRLIGTAAKNQAGRNPENTVFGVLRLLGCDYKDPQVQVYIKRLPFRVIDKAGKPVIHVEYRGKTKHLTPEEILSMIFTKARENAEAYLGSTVDRAVVTVPAYFNSLQTLSLRDMAVVAGLNVIRLINGPTAATMDYSFHHRFPSERNILAVDIGAGTSDFALTVAEEGSEGTLEVVSTVGNNGLGGLDFDDRLVAHCLSEFRRNRRVTGNLLPRTLHRLHTGCENAKCELSSQTQTQVDIDSVYDGSDLSHGITRADFDDLCSDFVRPIVRLLEFICTTAKIDRLSIHDVLVIGGSSRIPWLQKVLSDFVGGKALCRTVNADEGIAAGAAIQAAIVSGYGGAGASELDRRLLLDVLPMSFGVEDSPGSVRHIYKRNTTIPAKKSDRFRIIEDHATSFDVSVFEGDDTYSKNNCLVASLSLPLQRPRSPWPRDDARVEVTVHFDRQGLEKVTAIDLATGEKTNVYSASISWHSAKKEIERMQVEAAVYKQDEEEECERAWARDNVESHAYALRKTIRSSSIQGNYASLVEDILGWLYENQSVAAEEYYMRREDLKRISAIVEGLISKEEVSSFDLPNSSPSYDRDEMQASRLGEEDVEYRAVERPEPTMLSSSSDSSLSPRGRSSPPPGPVRAAFASNVPVRTKVTEDKDEDKTRTPTRTPEPSTVRRPLWLPLGPQEFRLLHSRDELKGELMLELKTHKVEYPPRYQALSYACGTTKKDKYIWVGRGTLRTPFEMSQTLFDALNEVNSKEIPIWVDAICINQTDAVEKGQQVALMHRIYRRAERVAIWLGKHHDNGSAVAFDVLNWMSMPPSTNSISQRLQVLPALKRHLEEPSSTLQVEQLQNLATVVSKSEQLRVSREDFRRLGIPYLDNPLWHALGVILSPAWLFRLWTFQEMILGKDCFVAYGKCRLPWRTYFDLGIQLSLCGLLSHCVADLPADRKARALTAFNRLAPFLNPGPRTIPFWRCLQEARQREVTENVDRVYAVLSLASERLRSRITVSYAERRKKDYWELFMETGKAVLETSTAQALLAGANSKTKAKELPSWCPDFTIPCEVVPFGARARAGLRYERSIPPHYDKRVVNIGGAKVDRVDHVVPFSWAWPKQESSEIYGFGGQAAQTLRWLDTCWSLTSVAYTQHEGEAHGAFVLTMLGEIEPNSDTLDEETWFNDLDESLIYVRKRLESLGGCEGPEDLDDSYETWQRFQTMMQKLDDIWRNRVFFTTKKNKVGFASDRTHSGDQICLFYGETHLYILRDRPAGFHEFVSDAYVDLYISGDVALTSSSSMVFKLN